MALRSMPAAFLGLSLLSPAAGTLAAAHVAAPGPHSSRWTKVVVPHSGVTAPRAEGHLPAIWAPSRTQRRGIQASWSLTPPSPYVGQTVRVSLELRMDSDWAKGALVQMFQQELALPVQVEAFALAQPGLRWIPEGAPARGPDDVGAGAPDTSATATTLVVDGVVIGATEDRLMPARADSSAGGKQSVLDRVVTIERSARATRAGSVGLTGALVRFTEATAFREDFVQGRIPVDPQRHEVRGDELAFAVQPIPEAGRPLGFAGAIGAFELDVAAPPHRLEQGVPFDLVFTARGSDPLPPGAGLRLSGMDQFTKLGVVREDQDGAAAFRVTLSSEAPGPAVSPVAAFDAFDPDEGRYQLVASASLELTIERRRKGTRPAEVDASSGGPPGAQDVPQQIATASGSTDGTEDAPRLPWTASILALVGLLALVSSLRRIAHRSRARATVEARPHVLMIGKYPLEAAAGDMVSVRRLGEHLRSAGFRVSYSPVIGTGTGTGELGTPPPSVPDLVHALNAEEPATLGAKFAKEWSVPLVVTTTGTDINRGLMELDRRATVLANLRSADRVLTLTEAQEHAVRAAAPSSRIERITQGIVLDRSDYDLRSAAGLKPDAPLALMLGGLRPVKGQMLAIDAWGACPGWHLVIAGDPVDSDYAETLRRAASQASRVTLLEALPHRDAVAALIAADVLLNTSESEGESRAILEAMTLGTPVVARRNGGNAALIEHGHTGLLFDQSGEIAALLREVAPGGPQTQGIIRSAMGAVAQRSELEPDEHALGRIYRELIGQNEGPGQATRPAHAASPEAKT